MPAFEPRCQACNQDIYFWRLLPSECCCSELLKCTWSIAYFVGGFAALLIFLTFVLAFIMSLDQSSCDCTNGHTEE